MKKHKNKTLKCFSQDLRKNMTSEERKLWYCFLKDLSVTVNRQKVFENYIVDFYCAQYNLIIEIDGTQHFSEDGLKKDKERDQYFNNLGIKVLRYSNYDINYSFNSVCEDILNNMPEEYNKE